MTEQGVASQGEHSISNTVWSVFKPAEAAVGEHAGG